MFKTRARPAFVAACTILCLASATPAATQSGPAQTASEFHQKSADKLLAAPAPDKKSAPAPKKTANSKKKPLTMAVYLDRLMLAESGGRDAVQSTTSTALGAYQFIESTFLYVAKTYFTKEVEKLSDQQILALRTNRKFARRAAEAYTKENAAILHNVNIKPTFPRLRLAYLVGPYAAIKILKSPPNASVLPILGIGVIRANPFMRGMTAHDLIQKTARDINTDPATLASARPGTLPKTRRRRQAPAIRIRCNIRLASCKRWRALALNRHRRARALRRKLDAKRAPALRRIRARRARDLARLRARQRARSRKRKR